jgi:hypothetical protein
MFNTNKYMGLSNTDITLEIKEIFDTNTLTNLKSSIKKRHCLNTTNAYLMYLFHLVQSAGIITTSFAASANDANLIWLGVGLNLFASLIHIYEKLNSSMMNILLHDINDIKTGHYVSENEFVDVDPKSDLNVAVLKLNTTASA